MSYGIQIKNQSDEIQIDSLYKNYALKQNSSVLLEVTTSSSPDTWDGKNTVNITDSSEIPIMVMKALSDDPICLQCIENNGSDYYQARVLFNADASSNETMYFNTYLPGIVEPVPDYGIVIRDSSNNILFHNQDTHFKIVGVYTGTCNEVGQTDVTVNDADNNYFYLYPFTQKILSPYGVGWFWFSSRGFVKKNSTTITVASFLSYKVQVPPGFEVYYIQWEDDFTLIEVEG